MMLRRYEATHQAISPFTGTAEEFFALLTGTVYYEMQGQKIESLAFVEGSEVTYVTGTDVQKFTVFAEKLAGKLLLEEKTVAFEADDCDEFAMKLKKLFKNQPEDSFDTYIL